MLDVLLLVATAKLAATKRWHEMMLNRFSTTEHNTFRHVEGEKELARLLQALNFLARFTLFFRMEQT